MRSNPHLTVRPVKLWNNSCDLYKTIRKQNLESRLMNEYKKINTNNDPEKSRYYYNCMKSRTYEVLVRKESESKGSPMAWKNVLLIRFHWAKRDFWRQFSPRAGSSARGRRRCGGCARRRRAGGGRCERQPPLRVCRPRWTSAPAGATGRTGTVWSRRRWPSWRARSHSSNPAAPPVRYHIQPNNVRSITIKRGTNHCDDQIGPSPHTKWNSFYIKLSAELWK